MKKIVINGKFIKRWSLIASAILVILFSCWVVDHLFVILVYGTDAYFIDNLRIVDSKHGILSNGHEIPLYLDIPRGIMTLLLSALIMITIITIVGRDILDVFKDNSENSPQRSRSE